MLLLHEINANLANKLYLENFASPDIFLRLKKLHIEQLKVKFM